VVNDPQSNGRKILYHHQEIYGITEKGLLLIPRKLLNMNIIDKLRLVAAKHKADIAIQSEDNIITYGSLIQRIDGLAAGLQDSNIGVGDCVAIALPRSFEMIIAIFGVLATGATYVPIDPSNPGQRILTILKDSGASLLLNHNEGEFLSATGIARYDPSQWPTESKPIISEPGATAYIIYTSGSTGNPKGVEVGHPALENYLEWATSYLPFTGGGVPLFTSVSFDHVITCIFPPLLMGDKIVLLPSIEGGRLLASTLLAKSKYSFVKITPSLFEFLDKDQRAFLGANTDLLMFGGEKLQGSAITDARRDNTSLSILNHYGPTETTVGCCIYSVPLEFSGAVVPIGKPIPGVEFSVRLDDHMLASGEEDGKLYVAGKCLANGYWRQRELTETTFLNLPGNDMTEKRWYNTGDIVRRLFDDNLLYLGRADDQIKILGNRIEPAEIVRELNLFPNLRQSVVFAFEHATYIELIAALSFFGQRPDIEDIRRHLLMTLPSVMVPTRYLILDELPVTSHGKIDITRLRSMVPKANKNLNVEEAVAMKFREILGIEHIGYNDDYFLSGGDSLGTVEITAWAEEQYEIPLEISCIFDFPTVTSLSGHIRSLLSVSSEM
jgi:amino acid adenylation domain-containing protein